MSAGRRDDEAALGLGLAADIGQVTGCGRDGRDGKRIFIRRRADQFFLLEMAQDLIELYAKRQYFEGIAFAKDTLWQKEFEESFIYEETVDQLRAVAAECQPLFAQARGNHRRKDGAHGLQRRGRAHSHGWLRLNAKAPGERSGIDGRYRHGFSNLKPRYTLIAQA